MIGRVFVDDKWCLVDISEGKVDISWVWVDIE